MALLNVDGLRETQFDIVNNTISAKSPDICVILETKFRKEQVDINVKIDGYEYIDRRRSNASLDRPGGGLIMYTRNDNDGCKINEYIPTISNPDHAFVHNERIWVTVTSSKFKTAVCGVYFGFQAGDDRHGTWNDILYNVLQQEIFELRQAGFRILIVGDFNAHVGNVLGVGIVGNHPGINQNGRRFLRFLEETNSVHLNGACRVNGDWSSRVSEGLWSWNRGGISTVIDYGVVSNLDLNSVKSF